VDRGPWGDPAVEHGFAAAYAPVQERRHLAPPAEGEHAACVDAPAPSPQDDLDEAADAAARPLTRDGRRARAPQPGRLSPARAVAGAAVSVAGVLLGIGTLLWVSDDRSDGLGPVVQAPAAGQELAGPFASQPEDEAVPVDPPARSLPSWLRRRRPPPGRRPRRPLPRRRSRPCGSLSRC
jgi:hypothetical protein